MTEVEQLKARVIILEQVVRNFITFQNKTSEKVINDWNETLVALNSQLEAESLKENTTDE